jgi:hypothetical protein
MPARQAAPCLKCGDIIEVSEAAFVLDLVLRFVGLPRVLETQRLSQASVSCCVTCADLMARGDEPPARTRPLDHIVYEQFKAVVSEDPTFAFLSWIEMRKTLNLPAPRLDDPKMLRMWNEFRRTMSLPALIEQDGGEGKTSLVKAS